MLLEQRAQGLAGHSREARAPSCGTKVVCPHSCRRAVLTFSARHSLVVVASILFFFFFVLVQLLSCGFYSFLWLSPPACFSPAAGTTSRREAYANKFDQLLVDPDTFSQTEKELQRELSKDRLC